MTLVLHTFTTFFLNNLVFMYKEKKEFNKALQLSINNKRIIILINNNLLRTFRLTFVRLFKTNNFGI